MIHWIHLQSPEPLLFVDPLHEARVKTDIVRSVAPGSSCRRCVSSRARPCVQCVHHDLKCRSVSSCSGTSAADGRCGNDFERALPVSSTLTSLWSSTASGGKVAPELTFSHLGSNKNTPFLVESSSLVCLVAHAVTACGCEHCARVSVDEFGRRRQWTNYVCGGKRERTISRPLNFNGTVRRTKFTAARV